MRLPVKRRYERRLSDSSQSLVFAMTCVPLRRLRKVCETWVPTANELASYSMMLLRIHLDKGPNHSCTSDYLFRLSGFFRLSG